MPRNYSTLGSRDYDDAVSGKKASNRASADRSRGGYLAGAKKASAKAEAGRDAARGRAKSQASAGASKAAKSRISAEDKASAAKGRNAASSMRGAASAASKQASANRGKDAAMANARGVGERTTRAKKVAQAVGKFQTMASETRKDESRSRANSASKRGSVAGVGSADSAKARNKSDGSRRSNAAGAASSRRTAAYDAKQRQARGEFMRDEARARRSGR